MLAIKCLLRINSKSVVLDTTMGKVYCTVSLYNKILSGKIPDSALRVEQVAIEGRPTLNWLAYTCTSRFLFY